MSSVSDSITTAGELAQRKYDNAVKRDYLHNAAGFVSFEFIWGFGLPFAMFTTVIPVYMAELNAPKSLIGIITSLSITMCPLQIVVSHAFRERSRKVWLTSSYMACVIPLLLYSIFFFYYPQTVSDSLQLALFCFCIVIFMGCCTGNFPVYFSLITDCTPLRRRGTMFGYRVAALALGLFLMAPAARWMMTHWPEPRNFLVAFIAANISRMVASLMFLFVREHRDPRIIGDRRHSSKINRLIPRTRLIIRKMLRDPNYRVFLFFTILFFISLITGSFIIVFAKEALALKGSQIITFTIVQIAGAAVFSVFLGKLADRIGYRTIGVIQGLLLTCGFVFVSVIALNPAVYVPAVYLGFFLYASVTMVAGMVTMNLTIELLPKQNSATLIALGNVLMMPAILITIPLAGLIIDLTGSYVIVFALGAALAAVSAFGFLVLVREPRKRKMYVIKSIRRV